MHNRPELRGLLSLHTQLEILATFALPLPAGVRVGVISRRSVDGTQSTESFLEMEAPDAVLTEAGVQTATVGSAVKDANGLGNGQKRLSFGVKPADTNVTLRVFVDHSVLETYAQGGRGVVTDRMYPSDDALGAGVFCNASGGGAGATLLSLDASSVGTIWVDKV